MGPMKPKPCPVCEAAHTPCLSGDPAKAADFIRAAIVQERKAKEAVAAKLKATEEAFAHAVGAQFTTTFCGFGQNEWLTLYHDLGGPAQIRAAVAKANAERAAERERCARIVESYDNTDPDRAIAAAAAEIRGGK